MLTNTQIVVKLSKFLNDFCDVLPENLLHVDTKNGDLSISLDRSISLSDAVTIGAHFDCRLITILPLLRLGGGAGISLDYKRNH